MNIPNIKIIPFLLAFTFFTSFELFSQESDINFAYVSVVGKDFSKKLKVSVDFGESDLQLKIGENFSEKLDNTKSYAAVLNYMDLKDSNLSKLSCCKKAIHIKALVEVV